MRVRDYMSSPAITISPEMGVQEALQLMRERKFRRLPVVNAANKLVGIVTERDLLYVSASPATSLSIWELNYLLNKMTVDEVMTKKLIVIQPDAALDDAARLLLEHKIGGMPVVDDQNKVSGVIGVITESDIFRAFLEHYRNLDDKSTDG